MKTNYEKLNTKIKMNLFINFLNSKEDLTYQVIIEKFEEIFENCYIKNVYDLSQPYHDETLTTWLIDKSNGLSLNINEGRGDYVMNDNLLNEKKRDVYLESPLAKSNKRIRLFGDQAVDKADTRIIDKKEIDTLFVDEIDIDMVIDAINNSMDKTCLINTFSPEVIIQMKQLANIRKMYKTLKSDALLMHLNEKKDVDRDSFLKLMINDYQTLLPEIGNELYDCYIVEHLHEYIDKRNLIEDQLDKFRDFNKDLKDFKIYKQYKNLESIFKSFDISKNPYEKINAELEKIEADIRLYSTSVDNKRKYGLLRESDNDNIELKKSIDKYENLIYNTAMLKKYIKACSTNVEQYAKTNIYYSEENCIGINEVYNLFDTQIESSFSNYNYHLINNKIILADSKLNLEDIDIIFKFVYSKINKQFCYNEESLKEFYNDKRSGLMKELLHMNDIINHAEKSSYFTIQECNRSINLEQLDK